MMETILPVCHTECEVVMLLACLPPVAPVADSSDYTALAANEDSVKMAAGRRVSFVEKHITERSIGCLVMVPKRLLCLGS
jgi:hypothetical protein